MRYNVEKMRKAFNKLCYGMDKRRVFDLFLDYCLQGFNLLDPDKLSKLKKVYKDITYDKENEVPDILKEMFVGLGEASQGDGTGLVDVLGWFYMTEVTSNHMGQFFTPPEICDLSASLVCEAGTINGKRKTVCDPACGSGTMLLSAAKVDKNFIFYGGDIDYTCAKMAALNMLINGLEGEISHIDTLRLEFYGAFIIGKVDIAIEGKRMTVPAYRWTTDKNESMLFNNPPSPEVVEYCRNLRPAYLPGLF